MSTNLIQNFKMAQSSTTTPNISFSNNNLKKKHTINPAIKIIDSVDTITLGNTSTNTPNNIFLKEYIGIKAQKKGISLEPNITISVTSPETYSKEFKELLSAVSNGIYGARVVDMFNLLDQPTEKVNTRIEQMEISENEKQEILKLKTLYDNYYQINADINDKSYNLLNLSEEDKKSLQENSPKFAKFIEEEAPELQKHTREFSKKEIARLRLDEAGSNSKQLAKVLAPILLGCVAYGVFKSKDIANQIKNNLGEFLKDQAKVLEEGAPKFQNPIKAFKNAKGAALLGLLFTTLAGSWDDLAGCIKDYQQDKDNFGAKKALSIGIPAGLLGVASSMAIAPMIEDQVSYNTAVKYLNKYADKLKDFNINIPELPKTGIKNIWQKGGKLAILGVAGAIVGNILKGIITASSSSGSSWGSMAGTQLVMNNLGNKMEAKKVITNEENSLKATNKNMMAYEAYKGKWTGIAQQDPIIGGVGGGLGLFTHSNPYLQSLSFGLQGCSETLTACYYQITGAHDRNSGLNKDKAELLKNAQNT